MIDPIREPVRVRNARALVLVVAELDDERDREELQEIFADDPFYWSPQTFAAALREALRRRWIEQVTDEYGHFYRVRGRAAE